MFFRLGVVESGIVAPVWTYAAYLDKGSEPQPGFPGA